MAEGRTVPLIRLNLHGEGMTYNDVIDEVTLRRYLWEHFERTLPGDITIDASETPEGWLVLIHESG